MNLKIASAFCFEPRAGQPLVPLFIHVSSRLKTVTKLSQYSIRAALTDLVLMNDITLILKSDWFALYAGTGTNQSIALFSLDN